MSSRDLETLVYCAPVMLLGGFVVCTWDPVCSCCSERNERMGGPYFKTLVYRATINLCGSRSLLRRVIPIGPKIITALNI